MFIGVTHLNLQCQFVDVLLRVDDVDLDFGGFLDDRGTSEPRDVGLGLRLTLALHGDERSALVRYDLGFLDEGRSESCGVAA